MIPKPMAFELFPFQKIGAEWLASRKYCLLADRMGLGKTPQAVVAAKNIGAAKILVLCPAIGRPNWQQVFKEWGNPALTHCLYEGGNPSPHCASASLHISSYDLLSYPAVWKVLSEITWDLLILDEAHYLKSLEAGRAKRVFGREGLARKTQRVWALTGTPSPNHAGELWILLYTFGVTELSYEKFIDYFCVTAPNSFSRETWKKRIIGTTVDAKKLAELRAMLAKIMLRRMPEEVNLELPPITFGDVFFEPSPVDIEVESSFIQYVYPKDRRAELTEMLRGAETLINTATEATALGESTFPILEGLSKSPGVSTLRRFAGLQKVPGIIDMVKDEFNRKCYDKLVIFAVHRDVIAGLRKGLSDYNAVTLFGGMPIDTKKANIEAFIHNPWCKVIICNIQAAGTSITLTVANHVLFAEQDWVPDNNAQAAMRCHRIGQTRPVFVRFCGVKDSFDEKIARVIKRKTKEIANIYLKPPLHANETSDTDLVLPIFKSSKVDEASECLEVDIFS